MQIWRSPEAKEAASQSFRKAANEIPSLLREIRKNALIATVGLIILIIFLLLVL